MINNKIIKIAKAELLVAPIPIDNCQQPGEIIESGTSFFVVKTIDGAIKITEWIYPDSLVFGETLYCQ